MLRVATVGIPELSEGWLAARMQEVWATSPGTVAVTLALAATALALSRRPGRPRGGWYRPSHAAGRGRGAGTGGDRRGRPARSAEPRHRAGPAVLAGAG